MPICADCAAHGQRMDADEKNPYSLPAFREAVWAGQPPLLGLFVHPRQPITCHRSLLEVSQPVGKNDRAYRGQLLFGGRTRTCLTLVRRVSSIPGSQTNTLHLDGCLGIHSPMVPGRNQRKRIRGRVFGLGRFERMELKTREIVRGSQGFAKLSAAELLTDCVGQVLKNFYQLSQGSLSNSGGTEERQSEKDAVEIGAQ
jgi:hypothetical protein